MSDSWKLTDDNRLVATTRLGIARVIFGLPLLLIGLNFFIRYFILAMVEYIMAGDWILIFTSFFGWIVVLFMSSLFLVPGWLLTLYRRRVVIDPIRWEIEEIQDYFVYKQRKSYRFDDFEQLQISWVSIKKSGSSYYQVSLKPVQGKLLAVASFEQVEKADELADKLAAMTGLPRKQSRAVPEIEKEEESFDEEA